MMNIIPQLSFKLKSLIESVGDLLLLAILILLAWKLLWFVAAESIWLWIGIPLLEYTEKWPLLMKLTVVIMAVALPVVLLAYFLFDEQKGILPYLEQQLKKWAAHPFAALIRGAVYCLSMYGILHSIWMNYELIGSDPVSWLLLLQQLGALIFG